MHPVFPFLFCSLSIVICDTIARSGNSFTVLKIASSFLFISPFPVASCSHWFLCLHSFAFSRVLHSSQRMYAFFKTIILKSSSNIFKFLINFLLISFQIICKKFLLTFRLLFVISLITCTKLEIFKCILYINSLYWIPIHVNYTVVGYAYYGHSKAQVDGGSNQDVIMLGNKIVSLGRSHTPLLLNTHYQKVMWLHQITWGPRRSKPTICQVGRTGKVCCT